MKTTIEIADPLFQQAKARCVEEGMTMKQLMERGLRLALDRPEQNRVFRVEPFGFGGEGPLIHDWSVIRELAYEGRGGVVPTGTAE